MKDMAMTAHQSIGSPAHNDIDLHLGGRLRRRRRLLGLTQDRLASAIGIRFQQIQKYECGANRMSAARLWQLAEALEVSVDYFYDGLKPEARFKPAQEIAARPAQEVLSADAAALVSYYYKLGQKARQKLLAFIKEAGGQTPAA